MRIASLLPGATEIVSALGMAGSLVGRSHECNFPVEVARVPVLTAPKIDATASAAAIDAAVRRCAEAGLSLYAIDEPALKAARPDLILTQAQCEVCAVSLEEVEAAVSRMIAGHPQVLSLSPMTLDDVWSDVRRVAAALDVRARGEALVADLVTRVTLIAARARTLGRAPHVFCLEWPEPLMAAGNWVPELVEIAGGHALFVERGRHSPWLTWEALLEQDPDVIVAMPCGFDLPRTIREMAPLRGSPEWRKLRAVRQGRVFLSDGDHYFNRPGPRLVEAAEMLAEMLHPTVFRFGHEGRAWVRATQ